MSRIPLAARVLNFWHKTEFFESTDIKDLAVDNSGVIHFMADELVQNPGCLPWLDRENARRAGKGFYPENSYHYSLYLGIFERSEIFTLAGEQFPDAAEPADERNQDEGRSCSISLFVDRNGVVDRDSLAFSTVTWALGQLQQGHLDNIELGQYEQATERLRQRFLAIFRVADNLKEQYGLPPVLTTFELTECLKAMAEWTEFTPRQGFALPALVMKLGTSFKAIDFYPDSNAFNRALPDLEQLSTTLVEVANKPAQAEHNEPPSDSGQPDIAILNSFYIRDIERAMTAAAQQRLAPQSPLGRYLANHTGFKPDLLTEDGRGLLVSQLDLAKLPAGRWPGEDSHGMSLMQQFAINTLEEELAQTGLYSVNGPPGTGKTTMLRDIVANNLVKRAAILATLPGADAAFSGTIKVRINDTVKSIRQLRPELTGFEMVVVSSNNAAVENISKELPQCRTLGSAYQDLGYLKPVAQKLAANHLARRNSKTVVEPVPEPDACWGLIAATLGNQKNREVVGKRLFYEAIDRCQAQPPANQYRTLWAALNDQGGADAALGFKQAQQRFLKASQKVEGIRSELTRLCGLAGHEQRLREFGDKVSRQQQRVLQLQLRQAKRRATLPRWWQLRFRAWCVGRAIVQGLALRHQVADNKRLVLEHQYRQLAAEVEQERLQCQELQAKYPDVHFAGADTDLESAPVQRKAFGLCTAFNQARGELFGCAMQLHEGWLVAAKSGLYDSLYHLMDAPNNSINDSEALKAIWQLFFMVVPVVSSTFASVARQFARLGEGDIGWLFVDEAGQATPQQAVGALWRAKRAVVVGDPLQIEPVFTIPPQFVEAFAKREFAEDWHLWSPTVTSVQVLADRANPFGTRQISPGLWLGSPLRVHRRCDEPMFSIANAIAYNDKMLHGSDTPFGQDDPLWGPSSWIDVKGEVDGKHFVPAQGEAVLAMLEDFLDAHQQLPDIYVISPFRKVKERLKEYLRQALGQLGVDKGVLNAWLKTRIGTVHTFQGKEEKSVIIVLGLSPSSPGAAKWASSKPNMLNVAVTRAQKRVYVIGDLAVWGGCHYFSTAVAKLAVAQGENPVAARRELQELPF
ncbi:MAG: ATP-binding protein [Pseudomonadota bacterium]|uniref:DEAD/DEAH box helicase n=1 Tax=Gallaecimonas pentaromativorans TaxID=584787 RepID=UPI0009F8FB7A|nr:ATP-binding protein [Gallaecimonas pentaromativorans]MED5524905.1 ATP-binding protein [Pseudomonadota bacterium]